MHKLFCVLLLATTALAFVAKDEIKALPGWDHALPSRQFSGYLNISEHKHMHYWFIQAEENADKAPIMLWLNGGPGCSSLYGMISENSLFRIHESPEGGVHLERFNQSWTRLANIFYLESPVGVGFSYSDNPSDYVTNDDKAADDNLLAVEEFFRLYPEMSDRPFFIAGESYAGIYVPTLAEAILKATEAGKYKGPKLHGIAVGNGCTGTDIGVCGGNGDQFETEYLLGQAFSPESLKQKIRRACNWTAEAVSSECADLVSELHSTIGNVNLYNIYGSCISGSAEENQGLENLFAPLNRKLGGPNPCIDSIKESAWMNRADVIEAIHVTPQKFRWSICGNQIRYTSTRKNLPRDTYPALIKNYRVLIFNGDWDACVPYTDNEAWTEGMGYEQAAAWHPWTYNGGQVGGYATRYKNNDFTFITVRGGRHEVPVTAPEQAFEMVRRFLNGEEF